MTYVINQLLEKGMVSRRMSQTDRRVTYVDITESGAALMLEIFPLHGKRVSQYFAAVTAEEL